MTKKADLLEYVELMNGAKLYLLPMPQTDLQIVSADAEREFETQGRKLEQPWYWSDPPDEQGRGGEKTYWDKDSVLKDGTEEEKAAWLAYERSRAELDLFTESAIIKHILVEATSKLVTRSGNELDLVIDPVTFEWNPPKIWRDRLGDATPDDPHDLKYLYLSSMVKDVETKRQIVSRCTLLSLRGAITEEDMARLDAIFRDQMEKVSGATSTIFEDVESGNVQGERAEVDVLAPKARDESDAALGSNTIAVGRARKKR